MSTPTGPPVFTASKNDPARAAEISDKEYERHLSDLQTVVMPRLAEAAATLITLGFGIVKFERRGGLASLVIRNRRASVDGWIYVQIHRAFGPLLSSERIFWMFSVRRGNAPDQGKPGRLTDLTDREAIGAIVSEFIGIAQAGMA